MQKTFFISQINLFFIEKHKPIGNKFTISIKLSIAIMRNSLHLYDKTNKLLHP
jgi:hypothetical protein